MQKKEDKYAPRISFKDQTPKVLVQHKKPSPQYEKAFLSRETETEDPFSLNTSTWD